MKGVVLARLRSNINRKASLEQSRGPTRTGKRARNVPIPRLVSRLPASAEPSRQQEPDAAVLDMCTVVAATRRLLEPVAFPMDLDPRSIDGIEREAGIHVGRTGPIRFQLTLFRRQRHTLEEKIVFEARPPEVEVARPLQVEVPDDPGAASPCDGSTKSAPREIKFPLRPESRAQDPDVRAGCIRRAICHSRSSPMKGPIGDGRIPSFARRQGR